LPDPQSLYATYKEQPNDSTRAALWIEIYQFFHQRLRDDDLASDSTTQAIEAIDSYSLSLGPLDKWLANIAANLRKDNQRKNHDVQVEQFELEILQNLAAPNRMMLDLSVIADPQTRMMAENIIAGYSIGEAAERCGLTPGAGYKRLSRLGKNISVKCLIR
jgi:DNA-directed RNA polymerase specialized sigma24 family protein